MSPEGIVRRYSVKKIFLEFRKIHRKTPVLETRDTFLIKLQALGKTKQNHGH